jgi:hypothetical protein
VELGLNISQSRREYSHGFYLHAYCAPIPLGKSVCTTTKSMVFEHIYSEFCMHTATIRFKPQTHGKIFVTYLLHFDHICCRYRQIPTFGQDTIRRFTANASAMRKLAARDFEDLLQVCLSVTSSYHCDTEQIQVRNPCF